MLRKPDWIPLYIQRAKASETWDLLDYKWCWFWKLNIQLADSNKPGYLPNDVGDLWHMAGAKTEKFFRERGGLELLARHFCRTEDGLWIYNARLLQILQEQGVKNARKKGKVEPEKSNSPPSSLSICSDPVVDSGSKAQEPEEFNGDKWVSAILNAHPRPEWGYQAMTCVIDAIEDECKQRKWEKPVAAEYVMARTQLYAQMTDRWPQAEKKFIPAAIKFFSKRLYNQHQELWARETEAVSGNFKSKTEQRSAHNSETARRTLELIERKANPVHVHGDSGGHGGGAAQPSGDPGVFFRSGKFKPGRDSEAVGHLPADEEIVR